MNFLPLLLEINELTDMKHLAHFPACCEYGVITSDYQLHYYNRIFSQCKSEISLTLTILLWKGVFFFVCVKSLPVLWK